MFKIGEIVAIRKLPESCNNCTQLQECRAYVGGYFDAHEIEYIDANTADIDDQFYGQGDRNRCIQSTLKVPLEDLRYSHGFIKPGTYIVEGVTRDYAEMKDYEITEEEVKEFTALVLGKEFIVDCCEVHEINSTKSSEKYLRSEVWPLGEFVDPEIQKQYEDKFEPVLHMDFKYTEYALYRVLHGLPEKDNMSISL